MTPPRLVFTRRTRKLSVVLRDVSRAVRAALPLVLAARGPENAVLDGLEAVEIVLLSDPAIAAVHGRFLNDPSPTDVITFHHGEILVSVDTAGRESAVRGWPIERELALYCIHGLLHLHGHDDHAARPRKAMHTAQDRILDAVWPV